MLKKAFFDYWDNFFVFAILNMVLIFSLAIPLGLSPLVLQFSPLLSLIILIIGSLFSGVVLSATALYVNEIAQFRSVEPKKFFSYMKESWKSGILYVVIWAAAILLVRFTFPFYSSMDNMVGLAAVAFLFWTFVIFLLAMQYYFPIRAQLDSKPGKILRKMFIIFFDNALFSIGLFIISAIVLALSMITAFLLIGPSGVMLLGMVGLKLRLYKYDYFEENPGQNRRKVPWAALIHEDRQIIGRRSFRGMIFPWKD